MGQLVQRIFERMTLAGEAGSLLTIEKDARGAVREIYAEDGGLFRSSDLQRWREAEHALAEALSDYAERAADGHTYLRRLFADDAVGGLGFIDIMRSKYDVILMNPPFGESSKACRNAVYQTYPSSARDVAAAFWARSVDLLSEQGVLGLLSTRTLLFSNHLAEWRRSYALGLDRLSRSALIWDTVFSTPS